MNPSSTPEILAFAFFGALAIVSAIATVSLTNTIRNAMGLFVHVLSLAGLYITLSAHFLTAVQLIVYVGAVVVLFIFVIMLLGPNADTPADRTGRLPRWIGAAAILGVAAVTLWSVATLRPALTQRSESYGTLREVGAYLFGPAMLPFEFASVLLTAAVIGAFAIARGHHAKVKILGDDLKSPGEPRPTLRRDHP